MKKFVLSLSLLASLACFNACTTDVALYADYKDIPVIYGLLNMTEDTNFIRINRAFSSNNENPINAYEVALIADSCNYPGKLKAYIVEYKKAYGNNYEPTGDTLMLDTMTIKNKEEGIFYSPNQKVYYTDNMTTNHTPIFSNNSVNNTYKYKLFVFKGNDTITSETGMVGGDDFKITTYSLHFSSDQSDKSSKIKFKAAENAVFYDMEFSFTYLESHNGGPAINKQVRYSCGTKSLENLISEGGLYYFSYGENVLFNLLKDAIGADTVNVQRTFGTHPIQVRLSAGADELYNYIQINSQSSFSQSVPDYTNISGGYGVFSSRINIAQDLGISAAAQRDLYGKTSWGFVQP